jgi:hypothetical protein
MILAVAFVIVAMLAPFASPGPAGAAYPSNFRRHQEQYWVWYAPKNWIAASGKNDLQISSPTGTLWNNYGAGGVICYEPTDWFKYLRNNYRNTAGRGQGIYSHPLRGAHFTRIGRIKQLPKATYGPAYFRQKVLWAGRRKGSGQVVKGEMIMDIFAIDAYGDCGQRFQTRGAPARGNAKNIRLLRLVQSTITQRNL